jgi:hypothetical protein
MMQHMKYAIYHALGTAIQAKDFTINITFAFIHNGSAVLRTERVYYMISFTCETHLKHTVNMAGSLCFTLCIVHSEFYLYPHTTGE